MAPPPSGRLAYLSRVQLDHVMQFLLLRILPSIRLNTQYHSVRTHSEPTLNHSHRALNRIARLGAHIVVTLIVDIQIPVQYVLNKN